MGRRATPAYTSSLAIVGSLVALALLTATVAGAWTTKTQILVAEQALEIAPPDLKRQVDKHLARFRQGVVAPFEDGDRTAHQKNKDGSGGLDQRIVAEAQRAIDAIRAHRPFDGIVYNLGVLSHYVADASNPLSTDEADPRERQYFDDYMRYVEGAQERYSLVFYGEGRDLAGDGAIPQLLARTFARGRRLYPSIGREYRRVGGPPGLEKFDDHSVAFAIGSIALSHAVSDVGAILRYVWLEAGGGDARELPVTDPGVGHQKP
jgi:hypothetical protein